MGIKVTNNAFATLATGIATGTTSITLASGQGARFPVLGAGDYFYATLINTSNQLEIIRCTARSGDVLTVVRAQEGTSARPYDVGDRVELRITAQTLQDISLESVPRTSPVGAAAIPAGLQSERDGTPQEGYFRVNKTTGRLEWYTGLAWVDVADAQIAMMLAGNQTATGVKSFSDAIRANTLATLAGDPIMQNGYLRRPGQVIETLMSLCDGSTVTVESGTYTVQNVTTQQTLSAAYQDINGSVITYTPPPGTTRVVYEFDYALNWVTEHAIAHTKFFIGADEVLFARHNRSGRYPEDRAVFRWVIPIGGTPNTNTGRLASWDTPRTLKMQSRWYSASNNRNAHGTVYWDGTSGNQFSMPSIKITALA